MACINFLLAYSYCSHHCFQNPAELSKQVSTSQRWRQGKPPPATITFAFGAAVVHNNTAYFSEGWDVYLYAIPEDKWSKLKPCSNTYFSMAVVGHKLTAIGGRHGFTATNTLLCLSGSSSKMKWKELLPPMPTERVRPAAVTTPTHLVVAGGRKYDTVGIDVGLSTVEVLNLHTLQWASATSSPEA